MADNNNSNIDMVNVTDLQEAGGLQDRDTLLLIRDTGTGKQCYRIAGANFNGKTAYEVAQEMGYTGSYSDWQEQISKASSLNVDFDPEDGCLVIDN